MPLDSLILLAALWALYFGFHSLLATDGIKVRVKQSSPALYRWYRLVYNLFAGAGFLAILLYGGFIGSDPVFVPPGWLRYAGLMVAAWGVIICRISFKNYSLATFIGLSDQKDEDEALVTTGILSYVRHPLYSGLILISLGYWLYLPNWTNLVTVASWWLYLPLGIWLEEKKLVKRHGMAYAEYKKRVPALVPSPRRILKGD